MKTISKIDIFQTHLQVYLEDVDEGTKRVDFDGCTNLFTEAEWRESLEAEGWIHEEDRDELIQKLNIAQVIA